MNFSIKDLVFQDKQVKNTSIDYEKRNNEKYCIINIESVSPKSPDFCLKCGCSGSFERKNYYVRKIKNPSINHYRVEILFKQLRFRCKECKKTVNGISDIVSKGARISNNLKEQIVELIKNKKYSWM